MSIIRSRVSRYVGPATATAARAIRACQPIPADGILRPGQGICPLLLGFALQVELRVLSVFSRTLCPENPLIRVVVSNGRHQPPLCSKTGGVRRQAPTVIRSV
jgi:hypothetical protein